MLCPTVLKMLRGQLDPVAYAFLGLSFILHASSALLCLPRLPVARLDVVSAVRPHGSELRLAHAALPTATKFLPLRQQFQSP